VQAARTPSPAAAATRTPKLGGRGASMDTSPVRTLDPHANGGLSGSGLNPAICYSLLLTYKTGPDVKPPSYIPTGDLADSWTQPDDLTYIFKLAPNIKWHNIPPVNGRELVADDIIYSYNRIREQKNYAAFLAGIAKMEAVDKATLKLTLEKPNADLL